MGTPAHGLGRDGSNLVRRLPWGALSRYGSDARGSLNAFDRDVRHTLDWLYERLIHWKNEVRQRNEEVREVRRELTKRLQEFWRHRGRTQPLGILARRQRESQCQ